MDTPQWAPGVQRWGRGPPAPWWQRVESSRRAPSCVGSFKMVRLQRLEVGLCPLFCLWSATFTEPPQGVRLRDSRQITEWVRAIAAPIVRALGLELVEVECVGQGVRTVLRVFIDKPGGVTVSDCEQVHLSLGHALDVEDPIPHAYTLEVSSPGLDRPLKRREDYRRALGQSVSIKLRHPLDGQWRLVGRLVDMEDAGVTLIRSNQKTCETIMVEWADIAEARREVEF